MPPPTVGEATPCDNCLAQLSAVVLLSIVKALVTEVIAAVAVVTVVVVVVVVGFATITPPVHVSWRSEQMGFGPVAVLAANLSVM